MGFFSRLRDSFKSTTAAKQRNERRGQSTPSTATGRVVDNLLTDIAIGFGRLDKSDVGQAGIDDYNARTKASLDRLEEQRKNRRDSDRDRASSTPAATTTTTTTTATAEPEPEPDPVIEEITPDTSIITDPPAKLADQPADPEPIADPDNAGENEGENAPDEPDTGAGTTTALGAEEEADELEKVAKGETEKKVADTIRGTGRRSTIRTTPRGLLSSDTRGLRPGRSLMSGGLLR